MCFRKIVCLIAIAPLLSHSLSARTGGPSKFAAPGRESDARAGDFHLKPGRYATSWIGQSFSKPGAGEADGEFLGMQAMAVYAAPDGTVFTNGYFDESGHFTSILSKDGAWIGYFPWDLGYGDGDAIAGNEEFIYFEVEGRNFVRYNRSTKRLEAKVPVGTSIGAGGMAASRSEVFVSYPEAELVKVFAARTGDKKREFPVKRPNALTIAPDGSLWIATGPLPGLGVRETSEVTKGMAIEHYTAQGAPIAEDVIRDVERPRSLWATPDDRLLVADDGRDQNIKIFSAPASGRRTRRDFGVVGGVFAGTGREVGTMGPGRFNHPTGVATDRDGNIYVTEFSSYTGGGAIVSSYKPDGTRNWVRYGLAFEDVADADPEQDTDLYDKTHHYKFDYARPPGREWSVVGYTHNRYIFPDDPRNHIFLGNPGSVQAVRVRGRKLLLLRLQRGGGMQVFRFDPEAEGETAIPCGLISEGHRAEKPEQAKSFNGVSEPVWPKAQPPLSSWEARHREGYIWCDLDGDASPGSGEFTQAAPADDGVLRHTQVMPDGDLWALDDKGLARYPFGGFTPQGVPKWDMKRCERTPIPAPFDRGFVFTYQYNPRTDVLVLAGFFPGQKVEDPLSFRSMAAYPDWSRGNREASWVTTDTAYNWPLDGEGRVVHKEAHEAVSLEMEGDYLFIAYFGGVEVGGVRVHRVSDGGFETKLLFDDALQKPFDADCERSVEAHRRADGEYVVFFNEHAHGRIVVYRWRPAAAASPR